MGFVLHAGDLGQALKQDAGLEAHFLDVLQTALVADAHQFIFGFDFVQALLERDAFALVRSFDAGRVRRRNAGRAGFHGGQVEG